MPKNIGHLDANTCIDNDTNNNVVGSIGSSTETNAIGTNNAADNSQASTNNAPGLSTTYTECKAENTKSKVEELYVFKADRYPIYFNELKFCIVELMVLLVQAAIYFVYVL